MKQKLLILLMLLTCHIDVSIAQNRKLSGKVTSAGNGDPLANVSVSISGSSIATQTDASGNYQITVESGSLLIFSFIGHTSKRILITDQTVLNVKLEPDEQTLEEVVVVGYGTTTKEAFTGSAKKIDAANIERKNVSNISQALAGEVSGLTVINTTGQPGTAATIRIRGLGSVNGNRSPLYVVDGVPYTGNLTSINNADIESVTVLKDGTATAIYGSRGANGVIMVSTKSGKGKLPFIEADFNFGTNASLLPRYETIKSPETYVGLLWESVYNQGVAKGESDPVAYANANLFGGTGVAPGYNMWKVNSIADLIDPTTKSVRPGVERKYVPEDWADYAFQGAARTDINVKMGGSSENNNFFTSVGYLKDKGYTINSDFERFSGRVNLDNKIKPWLNTGMNIAYSRTERNNNGQGSTSASVFWFADNMPSIYPLFLRDANGDKIEEPIYGGYEFDYGRNPNRRFAGSTNAIADATYGINRAYRNEINGRAYINFNILDGLTFENSLAINYYHNKFIEKYSKFFGIVTSTKGLIGQERSEIFTYTLLNMLRYRKKFGLSHNIEAIVAHESQDYSRNFLSGSKNQLVRDDSFEFDNAVVTLPLNSYEEGYAVESYFSQVNYDYDQKYYLSGSIRRDGTSRFVNNKWGTFGSIGAGWIISKENFMEEQTVFDFLKYKLSYGVIGDQSVKGYYPGLLQFPITNSNDKPAIGAGIVGNPDLSWETARMFQTGFDFEIGNYLTGSIEYYIKNTDNLIFERRVGPSVGYALITVNDGNLQNKGLEFDLTGHIVKNQNFYLDLGINAELFKNKITKMPIDPATGKSKIIDVQGLYAWGEGRSIYDFYIRDFLGVDPEDGRSKWKMYYIDKNGNGKFDASEQINSLQDFKNENNHEVIESETKTYQNATLMYVDKSALPKVRGAINLSAGYKGLTINAQFLYSIGGYAYDAAYASLMGNSRIGDNNWHKDMLGRWQEKGDITNVPRLSNDYDLNVNSSSTRFLTKADYFSLNNVRLGYSFNDDILEKIGFTGLSVWASGDNLMVLSARKGFNPLFSENGASSMYQYAPLSTFSVGLRAKF